jgi:hypothetical protein
MTQHVLFDAPRKHGEEGSRINRYLEAPKVTLRTSLIGNYLCRDAMLPSAQQLHGSSGQC